MSFKATFTPSPSFDVVFGTNSEECHAEFSPHIVVPLADYYDGDYTITPTAEAQTIPIIGKTARRNFTINPIPQNYGLITWDGATLTVS